MPMNHFMVLFSEAMLDWVGSYISHILILKTSQNVHDGGFFFFLFLFLNKPFALGRNL